MDLSDTKHKVQVIRKGFISICYNFKINSSTVLKNASNFHREEAAPVSGKWVYFFFVSYTL